MRLNSVNVDACPGCGRPFDGPPAGLNEMQSVDGQLMVLVPLCKRCLTVEQRGCRAVRSALNARLSKAVNAVHRGIVECNQRERAMRMPGRG
jgi:hypothetical protein